MIPTDRPTPSRPSRFPAAPRPEGSGSSGDRWHLGLDLGTTALSAVVWDGDQDKTYPIFWRQPTASGAIARTFQLAVALYGRPCPSTIERSRLHPTPSLEPIALGRAALQRARQDHEPVPADGPVLIQHLSSALQTGIPCRVAGDPWPREPQVQDGDRPPIPLSWVIEALAALLRSLREPTPAHPWPCGAVGLSDRALQQALNQLGHVLVGQPLAATEAYRFNLREAVLTAGLVADPAQVIFLDQPLAAALADVPSASPPPSHRLGAWARSGLPPRRPLVGSTLVIDGGASGVGLAILDGCAVESGLDLRRDRPAYSAHKFPWGGQACDVELVVQHFAARLVDQFPDLPNLAHPPAFDPVLQGRSLRVLLRNDAGRRSLAAIEQLRMQLQSPPPSSSPSSPQGPLQQMTPLRPPTAIAAPPPVATFKLAGQTWTLDDGIWERMIVRPWLARFNQELNHLLCQSGCPTERITRIVWVGGFGPMPAVRDWLGQKFPGATWVYQPTRSRPDDRRPEHRPPEHRPPDLSSAIAHGLARLPQFPALLASAEPPYSDYFLWVELLSALPTDQPLPEYHIRHILNERGVNVRACGDRLRALLRGKRPAGLVPPAPHPAAIAPDSRWAIAPISQVHPLYVALRSTPLLSQDAQGNYWLDGDMASQWRRYLGRLLVRSHQPFQEPCLPEFAEDWGQDRSPHATDQRAHDGMGDQAGDRWGDWVGSWASNQASNQAGDRAGDLVGDLVGDRASGLVGDRASDRASDQIYAHPSLP